MRIGANVGPGMGAPRQLLDDFLPHLPASTQALPADSGALGSRLDGLLAEARAAWPTVELPAAVFLPYLAARLPEGDPLVALAAVSAGDLYLACACVRGDARAIVAFEAAHFPMVEAALAGMRAASGQVDEVKQLLREQLFVGPDGQPTLTGYSGRGALGGWLRVTAVRVALRVLRRDQQSASPSPDLIETLPASDRDPELEHLKIRYRLEFKEAFEAAVQQLGRRERSLLRYHHVDGLTVDEIGELYHVHRATAARWVAKARDAVLAGTRRELGARLRLQRGEYESIMRLIQSQLHVSLSAILPPLDDDLPEED